MNSKLREMLSKYSITDERQANLALREILQEIVLCGLSRSGFFSKAAFTGGTALRIVHGIERFSEDLDFSLKKKEDIDYSAYLSAIKDELNSNGFDVWVDEKSRVSVIKSAFVKGNTQTLLANIFPSEITQMSINSKAVTKIKIEIDTNPPEGATYETYELCGPDFYSVECMDLSSMFALKTHAIMCRGFIKGRDYYDYLWFIKNNVPLNLQLLNNALYQTNAVIENPIEKLANIFSNIDVSQVIEDIQPFIKNHAEVDKWSNEYFMDTLNRITILDEPII